jgi:hypothetical protein
MLAREREWMDAAMHQQGSRDTSREYRTTDANLGEPWYDVDVSDPRTNSTTAGRLQRPQAVLCRDVYEVRAKMKELRLTEQPSKRRVGFYNNRTPYSPAR